MIILILHLLNSNIIQASSIFVPDSDTALLFELVTTTISQLNELELLVTNTQKLTVDMQKYNELAIDHWYRAKRVAYIVEDFKTLSETKIENLGELNQAIRELKYNIQELENMMLEYGIIKNESEKLVLNSSKDNEQIKRDIDFANLQIKRAHEVETVGNAQKVNTQINAYANKSLVDIKNKSNQTVKILAEQNKMLSAKEISETKDKIEKLNFYNIKAPSK